MSNENQEQAIFFGELENDLKFKSQVQNIHDSIDKVGNVLQTICGSNIYSQLSKDNQVNYDIFLSYSLSSLYWMYLRTKGIDPNNHQVKAELDRVKGSMTRQKKVRDRFTIRPVLDKDAAKRFVRSGLWSAQTTPVPAAKKKTFK